MPFTIHCSRSAITIIQNYFLNGAYINKCINFASCRPEVPLQKYYLNNIYSPTVTHL